MIPEEEIRKIYDEMAALEEDRQEKWVKTKEDLKELIHPKYFDFIESMESFDSEGVVEIQEVDEKQSGYPSSQRNCRIKGEEFSELYMYTTSEVEYLYGIEGEYEGEPVEYWVNQWSVGMDGDSYVGVLLFPLNNGKHWKVGYSC